MFWVFLFANILKIQSKEKFCKIERKLFLGNDCWRTDHEGTNMKHLYELKISMKDENEIYDVQFNEVNCMPLEYTGVSYGKFDYPISNYINSKSNDLLSRFLKFEFTYTEDLIRDKDHFEEYKGKKHVYKTFKLLKKNREDKSIRLIRDGIIVRKFHIKEMFIEFFKLLNLPKHIFKIDENLLAEKIINSKDDLKFDPHYFKNYTDCRKNLNLFVKNMPQLFLSDDNSFLSKVKKFFDNNSTTINVSEFKKILFEKIQQDQKNGSSEGVKCIKKNNSLKSIFNMCCDHIINEIMKNNLFLPIGKNYSIDFYLIKIHELIYDSLKITNVINCNDMRTKINCNTKHLIKLIDCGLEKIQTDALNYLYGFVNIPDHFSKLLGKDIRTLEDYIIVEKIVCDYYNMILFIYKIESITLNLPISFKYSSPIFIDNYNFVILDGIEISFIDESLPKEIQAFNQRKELIYLKESYNFLVDKQGNFFFTSDILRAENIHELAVFSPSKKTSKRFKVKRYVHL